MKTIQRYPAAGEHYYAIVHTTEGEYTHAWGEHTAQETHLHPAGAIRAALIDAEATIDDPELAGKVIRSLRRGLRISAPTPTNWRVVGIDAMWADVRWDSDEREVGIRFLHSELDAMSTGDDPMRCPAVRRYASQYGETFVPALITAIRDAA